MLELSFQRIPVQLSTRTVEMSKDHVADSILWPAKRWARSSLHKNFDTSGLPGWYLCFHILNWLKSLF